MKDETAKYRMSGLSRTLKATGYTKGPRLAELKHGPALTIETCKLYRCPDRRVSHDFCARHAAFLLQFNWVSWRV